ncbi:MAG: DODA-type extradiol aromatic ring-opening family dioxygenase [Alphaproteobacteria bacterium]
MGAGYRAMETLPALFLSHGSPMLAIEPIGVNAFASNLAQELPRPRAVLCVSAHWETLAPRVSAAASPATIHDFYGFPAELYHLRYPAPGSPDLAERVAELLGKGDIPCDIDPERGLDHGAWVPLMIMYPRADIPIVQLSIQTGRDGAHHLAVGRALAPLRQEGILVVGSGNATHNLAERGPLEAAPVRWAQAFDDWLLEAVSEARTDELVDFLQAAPDAIRNHPTPDHYWPLIVALGAGGEGARGRRIYAGFTYGTLSMAAFAFA